MRRSGGLWTAPTVSAGENEQKPGGYRRSEHHSEAPEDHATVQPFVIAVGTIAKYHGPKIRERCGVHHCGRNCNCNNKPRDSYRSCSEQWHRYRNKSAENARAGGVGGGQSRC